MALFGKDRERDDRPRGIAPAMGAPPDPRPQEVEMFERDKTRPEESSGTSAFLGKGARIVGKLTFEGSVRIEGQVEGEITAQDTLTIGEGAVVKAKINGTSVVVHGHVTGDIAAQTRLELRAPSKVVGNISTPNLVIQEGAVFEGNCTMGGAAAGAAASDPAKRGKKPDFSVLLRDGDATGDVPPAATPLAPAR
jgi:cytoskeletal protein CcmA (bactofilin family)